jgi:hypothetical protein
MGGVITKQFNIMEAVMSGRKRIKPWVWVVLAFVAIIIFGIVADWWKTHSALGWTIVVVLVLIIAFLAYRYASVRGWLGSRVKSAADKIIFEKVASGREPLPVPQREEVLKRARNRCENERCNYKGQPHIHHIDGNNSHNNLSNLVALCPNCHQQAHDGILTESQLHNWVKRDFQRLKARRSPA